MEFEYGVAAPVSPGIVRIVANNPSPFTFKGTNTYLVGTTALAVIDPGPDDERHCDAILRAAGGRPISHILITHAHRDHIDGAPRLKSATGAITCSFGRSTSDRTANAAAVHAAGPSGTDFVNYGFEPDWWIQDGDAIEGEDWTLDAIHTPGHAPDHVCFALTGRRVLFSGDDVMAWNTTVIAPPEGNMADHMSSLERLLERNDRLYLPGHGGRIEEPLRTVKAYLIHRRWREQAILEAVQSGKRTIRDIVPVVYPDIGSELTLAASFSVLAHVEHLIARGLVACEGSPTLDRRLLPS
jgi:glyoxylase-like metal-dependent hydrolase (beta-lactamase superfamily II)